MVSRTLTLPCPICDEPVAGTPVARVVVDDVRGEDAKRLARGRLNEMTCPLCGHRGVLPEAVTVAVPSRMLLIGYMPVEVPPNRKERIAGRIRRQVAAQGGSRGEIAVCFGPAQLRRALPDLPWPARVPAFWPRFDEPGPPKQRVRNLRRALSVRPDDAALLARLGGALYDMGRLAEARKTLERALAANPADAEALLCLGSVALDEGRAEEALQLYDRLVAMTHEPLPRFLAGVAAYRAGRPQAAWERLRMAVRQQPEYVEAHIWLALVHLAMDDRAGALTALRTAMEYGLKNPERILRHPEFQALRSDRTFRHIISTLRRRYEKHLARSGRAAGAVHDRGGRGGPDADRARAR